MTPRISPFALMVLCALSLGACSAIDPTDERPTGGIFNPGVWSSHEARMREPAGRAAPVAALPSAAGRVVDVREKRFDDGLSQEIALTAGSGVRGENVIEVAMRDQPVVPPGRPQVRLAPDDDAAIAAEIERRFPGADMRIRDAVLRNAYGPYGIATGRLGAANCVFVWQRVADLKAALSLARVSPYPIETSVRVRLCHAGASVGQLAQWASSYVLDPAGAAPATLESGASADALSDALDAPRGAARPGRFVGYAASSRQAFADEAPATRVASAPRRVRAARLHRPSRVARRPVRVAPAPAQEAAPQTAYVQPAAVAVPGARPVWTQPGATALMRSATPASGGAFAPGALGLPPQAFAGPSSRTVVATPR